MGKQQFCTFILIDGKVDGRIKCTTSIDKSCVGFKLSHAAATGKNDDIKDLNNGGIYFCSVKERMKLVDVRELFMSGKQR